MFPIVKLLDYAAQVQELEASPNPFAVVVLAHLKTLETRQAPEDRRLWKLKLVKGLYERGMSAEHVRRLFRFIDWVMVLPKALGNQFWQEFTQYEESKRMPFITTPERIGLERGLIAGIEVCLRMRFGDEAAKIVPEIRELADHEQMQAVLDAIATAGTLDELRHIWTTRKTDDDIYS